MGLTFKVHTQGLEGLAAPLEGASTEAEHILAQQVAKDTARFVPMRKGSLRERTRVVENKVIYTRPYARYLYYGKLYVDPVTGSPYARKDVTKVPATPERDLVFHHPGTRSHWFEASKAQNIGKWIRIAGKAVKHEL